MVISLNGVSLMRAVDLPCQGQLGLDASKMGDPIPTALVSVVEMVTVLRQIRKATEDETGSKTGSTWRWSRGAMPLQAAVWLSLWTCLESIMG
jgi:hypothetical protein